jgi:PAS domain S-box-containing protein
MRKQQLVNTPDICRQELKQSKKAFTASEKLHRNLIDYMRNGYAYCRLIFEEGHPVDFIHVEVNKGYEQLTGLKNVVGRRMTEVLPGIAELNPEFIEKHFRVAESGLPDQFEIYLEVLKKWYDISLYCPKKGYFVAMIDDITERKEAERALMDSERKFRSITEQMADMVFITDASGYLIYVSPAIERMAGYKPHEVIGQPFTDYLAEEDIPGAVATYQDAMSQQLTSHSMELKYRKKNGSIIYCEVQAHYYHENEFRGTIGVLHDITERNHIENIRKEYELELLESRQFLQNIYDTVNHSIFVVDVLPDGVYRYKGINPLHERLTGFCNEDISGKTPEELLPPAVADAVIRHYDRCIRDNKTIQYEECLPFRGKNTWWTTVLNPVRNDAGHIYRIIGTSTNITERKLAEEKLNKLSVAVQQSPAVVIITDPLGNIEYINPTFTLHTGYSAEEVIGQNPRILKSGLMPQEVYEELWQTIHSGGVWHGELHNRKKNGELYWEVAVISAIVNKEGVITNFVGVKEDITEKKKLWLDLVSAKEKAEESDRLKTAFLANLSHEIRTPMNGILGFAELLKEPHLSGELQAEYIELINQSGQRMLNLINDLIDISRIEAGESMVQITETQVNALLCDLCSFFKSHAENKKLRLTCTKGLSDSESIIETDSSKLTQVLTNLVQNALKFTLEGNVDIGYTKKDEMLEFYVKDSGIGIPAEMSESIFERFRQVDSSITRLNEGSGLGLSISKAYVEMLGGTIRVESVPGRGSEFLFTLPYNPPGSLKIALQTQGLQVPVKLPPGITLVTAEDDTVSTILLQRSLRGEKVTIHQAKNGREAVELVERHPEVNLVLMDINMPVMNGFEATRAIKKLRPRLPVIAQTAFASKEDENKAFEAGCDGFITKPINKKKLVELIQSFFER